MGSVLSSPAGSGRARPPNAIWQILKQNGKSDSKKYQWHFLSEQPSLKYWECIPCPRKKVKLLIFDINLPSVDTFLPIFEAFCSGVISVWYSLLHLRHSCYENKMTWYGIENLRIFPTRAVYARWGRYAHCLAMPLFISLKSWWSWYSATSDCE